MPPDQASISFKDYLTVGEAAQMLGVTSSTMRNWDRAGKLKPVRHPVNGYRLYKRIDLESLLQRIFNTDPASGKH